MVTSGSLGVKEPAFLEFSPADSGASAEGWHWSSGRVGSVQRTGSLAAASGWEVFVSKQLCVPGRVRGIDGCARSRAAGLIEVFPRVHDGGAAADCLVMEFWIWEVRRALAPNRKVPATSGCNPGSSKPQSLTRLAFP